MKITTYTTPEVTTPPVMRTVRFDWWPFEDRSVELNREVWWINDRGELINDEVYYLGTTEDDVLVVLADGRVAVTNEEYLGRYLAKTGQERDE